MVKKNLSKKNEISPPSIAEPIQQDYIPLNKISTVVFKRIVNKRRTPPSSREDINSQSAQNTICISHFPAHWINLDANTSQESINAAFHKIFSNFGQIQFLESVRDPAAEAPAVVGKILVSNEDKALRSSTGDDILGVKSDKKSSTRDEEDDAAAEKLLLDSMLNGPDAHWLRIYIQYRKARSTNAVREETKKIISVIKSYQLIAYSEQHPAAVHCPLKINIDLSDYFSEKSCRKRHFQKRVEQDKIRFNAAKDRNKLKEENRILNDKRWEYAANIESTMEKIQLLKEDMRSSQDSHLHNYEETLDSLYANLEKDLDVVRSTSISEFSVIKSTARSALKSSKTAILKLEKKFTTSQIKLPTAFEKMAQMNSQMFLRVCQNADVSEIGPFENCTLLVPIDEAFCDSTDNFESHCWRLHKLPGSYQFGDLANMAGGVVHIENSGDGLNETLRVKLDVNGKYNAWYGGDSDPPTLAKSLVTDIYCANGVVLHLVDHILFPE